ncbi:Macrocin O-methyltransferase [Rubripirellula obstinata]|uniref:Macrocin O-methyltransferase n=2 Tax=Rubripirellula obstinata TaxID=406547 RepID=A0A5B1CHI1_9BACT|nr:TylF/MycF/NovP-related O-methyltransferase [Rubripirellula obstinata]KAA1259652.1 Macrocin O-methyltransferase [Rubripirellula obstinata]
MKRLIPNSIKDLLKRMINRGLTTAGWKLAPFGSIVVDGQWYDGSIDGVVSKHRSPALDDADFKRAIQHLCQRNAFLGLDQAVRGETTMHRLHLAGQLARLSMGIEGDLVEFGTFRGATAYCMLNATKEKSIYLYDTFSGIPEHGVTDHERAVGLLGSFQDTSADFVRENLSTFADRIHIREGLIPDTLNQPGPTNIAMMHVDLNLVKPTLQAIQWAFPRWASGGICLLDDYLWDGYEDQRAGVERFFAEQQRSIIALPTGQGIVFNITN